MPGDANVDHVDAFADGPVDGVLQAGLAVDAHQIELGPRRDVVNDLGAGDAVAALLDLAGEKAQAVKLPDEPELDETWEEPPAFGGCSTQGQAAPNQPQPIQIMKRLSVQAANATPLPGARA